jgi:hypothetical protein
VLVEAVLRPGPWSDWFKLLDLHMLILLGGRERTEDEWRALLRAGGFELETVAEGTGATLLEAARLPAATIEPKANPGAS